MVMLLRLASVVCLQGWGWLRFARVCWVGACRLCWGFLALLHCWRFTSCVIFYSIDLAASLLNFLNIQIQTVLHYFSLMSLARFEKKAFQISTWLSTFRIPTHCRFISDISELVGGEQWMIFTRLGDSGSNSNFATLPPAPG